MEKEDLIKKLETVEVPKIEIQSHKSRLKVALLTFHSFSNAPNPKVRRFSMAKKFAPIGAVVLVALLIAGVMFIGLKPRSKVDAREVVNKAVEAVKSENGAVFIDLETGMLVWKGVDPDGKIRDPQGNVIAITNPDGKIEPVNVENAEKYVFTPESFLSTLEEAREAQDLTYLGNKVLSNGEKVKIFRFTDKKGITNIVGIDKNNLPVVGFAYRIDKDGGFMTEIVGSIGSADEISISGGNTEPGDSGISRGSISDKVPSEDFVAKLQERIKYWTENLEKP